MFSASRTGPGARRQTWRTSRTSSRCFTSTRRCSPTRAGSAVIAAARRGDRLRDPPCPLHRVDGDGQGIEVPHPHGPVRRLLADRRPGDPRGRYRRVREAGRGGRDPHQRHRAARAQHARRQGHPRAPDSPGAGRPPGRADLLEHPGRGRLRGRARARAGAGDGGPPKRDHHRLGRAQRLPRRLRPRAVAGRRGGDGRRRTRSAPRAWSGDGAGTTSTRNGIA